MRRLLKALPLVLAIMPFVAASAEEKVIEKHLVIDWREAQIIKLDGMAASVVIGDPTVADVSLEDPQTLILFGKGTGETNLLVFNAQHKLLLNSSITVSPEMGRHVSVYGSPTSAATEVLYSCGSRCVRVLSPTDIEFESKINTNTEAKSTSNQDSSESSAVNAASGGPRAPQTSPQEVPPPAP